MLPELKVKMEQNQNQAHCLGFIRIDYVSGMMEANTDNELIEADNIICDLEKIHQPPRILSELHPIQSLIVSSTNMQNQCKKLPSPSVQPLVMVS